MGSISNSYAHLNSSEEIEPIDIVFVLRFKQIRKAMYRILSTTIFSTVLFLSSYAQITPIDEVFTLRDPSLVDYDAYVQLVTEVQNHRQQRLISLERFNSLRQLDDVIILDTRSKAMYDAKHVKGAIHLNFSDFTQENLETLIPSKDTKILIYCNNNFLEDPIYFMTKSYTPPPTPKKNELGITMALNIPTYINLYGYGFKNVYELKDLIPVSDPAIAFEGTSVLNFEEGN